MAYEKGLESCDQIDATDQEDIEWTAENTFKGISKSNESRHIEVTTTLMMKKRTLEATFRLGLLRELNGDSWCFLWLLSSLLIGRWQL